MFKAQTSQMRFLHFALFSFFLSITAKSFEQTKFLNGFYINQNGDTVKGYTSLKSKDQGYFEFKSSLQEKPVSILFDTCKQVGQKDRILETWLVSRNMSYVDKFSFDIINQDSLINAFIPLESLYKGSYFSLYSYHDIKDHFFIYDGVSMQELRVSYRYLTDWEKMQNVNRNMPKYLITPVYKKQITSIVGQRLTKKQWELIENTGYDKKSFIRLFKTLNESDD